MTLLHEFKREERLPSYFANRLQDFLSTARTDLRLTRKNETEVEVAPAEPYGVAGIDLQGLWRFRDTAVSRVHPGGGAGTYTVWAVGTKQKVVEVPKPFTDETDYSFDLRITNGANPAGAGVEVFEKIGEIDWDGAKITALRQTYNAVLGQMITDGALSSEAGSDIEWTRAPNGGLVAGVKANAIGAAELADLSVDTAALIALAVTEAKIAAEAITTGKLANLGVTAAKLGAESVEEAKIKELAVSTAKLAALAVTEAKLGAEAVSTAKIKLLAVTSALLAAEAVETGKIKNLAVTEGKLAALAVTAAKLGEEAVETAKLKNLAVTEGKLAGEAVGTPKIAALAVTAAKIAAEAVETGKIKLLAITAALLAAEAVETGKIAALAVTEAKLAAEAVATGKIANLAVTAAKLGAEAVETGKIKLLAITAALLGEEAVETGKIKNLAVTEAKLAAESVATGKIANLAVTAGKLAELAVTEAKIADGAVSSRKHKPTSGRVQVGSEAEINSEVDLEIGKLELTPAVASKVLLIADLGLNVTEEGEFRLTWKVKETKHAYQKEKLAVGARFIHRTLWSFNLAAGETTTIFLCVSRKGGVGKAKILNLEEWQSGYTYMMVAV